ncbi:lipopolysaccharide assembly LapA domain-containing protein [Paenibacillus sp. RC84]|uniref:LapA family protein n=1 Tax=Paenibacillus sp. RC84 TaxID=3156252 RepID=UPI0035156466
MKSNRIQWLLIGALIFALITTVFAVVNMDQVRVNFVFMETNAPLILVIVISTVLGGLIVGLFGILRQVQMQKEIKELRKQLKVSAVPADTEVLPGTAAAEAASASYEDRLPGEESPVQKEFGKNNSGAL